MVSGQTTQPRPTPRAAAQNGNDNYLPCVKSRRTLSLCSPRQLSLAPPIAWQTARHKGAEPAGPEPVCQTQMTRPMMPSPTIVITVSGLAPIDSPHGSRREALSNRSRDAANPNRIRDTQCQLVLRVGNDFTV